MTLYHAMLVDVPWDWKSRSAKGTGRGAVSHYDTLDLNAVKALRSQVLDLAATDCAMFFWAINSMTPEAMEVIKA
jgi:hypothetical protein